MTAMETGQTVPEDTMDLLPLLSPEVIDKVMKDLRRQWFIEEMDQYCIELQNIWLPRTLEIYYDHKMLDLDSIRDPQKRGRRIPYIDKKREYLFCNKTTVFYWTESATTQLRGRSGNVILGGIWNAWCDALGREPHFQLDEFFAVPVRVKEQFAKTIPGILRAHKQICAQIRKSMKENSDPNTIIGWQIFWPNPRYFKLQSLCEALITVFDEFLFHNYRGVAKHVDGFRHFDDVAQKESILLVRTGNENGLSAPISFESLKDQALPLARSEDMGNIDIIRVTLQVGVRFVANLLLREQAAFPESVMSGPHLSSEPDHPFTECERAAKEDGEKDFARAHSKGKITPFSDVAAVKEAVGCPNFDHLPPDFVDRFPFRLGWV